MGYVLYRAVNRVKHQRKRYLWLAAQVMVGVCVLSAALNLTLSFQRQEAEYRRMISRPFADLTVSGVTLAEEERDRLRETGAVLFYQFGPFEGNTAGDCRLFVDDAFYPQIMGMETPPPGKALAGKNAASPSEGSVPLEGLEYDAKTLLSLTLYTPDSIQAVSFDDCVVYPLEMGPPAGTLHVAFPLAGDEAAVSAKLNGIHAWLAQAHPQGEYVLNNYARQVTEHLNRNAVLIQMFGMVSGFILLIVTLGFTGLLLVLINGRRRELAVSLMCGAAHRRLMAELFLEVFLVMALSAAAGNLLCVPFLPMFGAMGTRIAYSFSTLGACVAGAGALSLLAVSFSFGKIAGITPVMVLKDL